MTTKVIVMNFGPKDIQIIVKDVNTGLVNTNTTKSGNFVEFLIYEGRQLLIDELQ